MLVLELAGRAAGFCYGEMEMRRQDRTNATRAERGLLSGYWLLSGYGLLAVLLGLAVLAVSNAIPARPLPEESRAPWRTGWVRRRRSPPAPP
ncbi:hypothetical protein [Streptomyces sp. NPDC102283]|uniref:hypothetical protein n=1 Tax=Streptomyces sp. NPDC102283 TaxID=3366155 RepID=UPI00382DD4B8